MYGKLRYIIIIICFLISGVIINIFDNNTNLIKEYESISKNDLFDNKVNLSSASVNSLMADNGDLKNNSSNLSFDSLLGSFDNDVKIIKTSNGCDTEYAEGQMAGLAECSTVINNFSGQQISICSGIGNCGGQTYTVNWGYDGKKRLDLVIDPKLFSRVEYNYDNTDLTYEYYATGKENASRDGYDCAWNNSYKIYLVDSVTGQAYASTNNSSAKIGYINIDANYPNPLFIEARWYFKPNKEKGNCIARAYTNSVRVTVR